MVLTDPRYDIPRDLEGEQSVCKSCHLLICQGYGEEGFDPQWPNGAKIAISFVLNYEEGAERTPVNGDDQSEPYLWEKGASSVFRHGHRYINAESEYEYGSRSGAWRILRLFKEFGWNYTTYAVAQAMEKNPSFAKACVREGHEIAAHGYRWLDLWDMTLDEDRENIRKALVSLKESTGEWPVGMYFGRGTPNTKGLFPEIWEEMVEKKTPGAMPMLYCSEAYNDDVPYWQDLPAEKDLPDDQKKGMLIVPYNYDCNGQYYSQSFTLAIQAYTNIDKMENFTCRQASLALQCIWTI